MTRATVVREGRRLARELADLPIEARARAAVLLAVPPPVADVARQHLKAAP